MGKIRVKTIGIDEVEVEQKRKSAARREGKKAQKKSKEKIKGVGLKGGERTAIVEGLSDEQMKKLQELEQKPLAGESDKEAKTKKKSKAKKEKKERSKRYKTAAKLIDRKKLYPIIKALELVKKTSTTKFEGSVEIHVILDPKTLREKPSFRGTVSFPHGTGKQVRVAIATDALIKDIEGGTIEFDVLVASPDMMPKLARVARILGPKGLMPNPKTGTIGKDPEKLAQKLSKGQVAFKTEPDNSIVHIAIGKVSFEASQLQENLKALIAEIGKSKIESLTINATMGPGIKADIKSL